MASIDRQVDAFAILYPPGEHNAPIAFNDVFVTPTLIGMLANVRFDATSAFTHLGITSRVVEIRQSSRRKVQKEYKIQVTKKMQARKSRTYGSKKYWTKFIGSRRRYSKHNSKDEIEFTFISDKNSINSYRVILYEDGRVFIRGIARLLTGTDKLVKSILKILISYISRYPDVFKIDKTQSIELEYLLPVMYEKSSYGGVDSK